MRLLVVAHAATPGTYASVFGDDTAVTRPEQITPLEGRVAGWICGPEPACAITAVALGAPTPEQVHGRPEGSETQRLQVVPELAGPDFGRWAGRALAEVGAEDAAGVQAWLTAPDAAPHGGESLEALVDRVGAWMQTWPGPDGRSVAVVTPLVARALAVHALGVAAAAIFRLDVAPLGRLHLSRGSGGWRVRLG